MKNTKEEVVSIGSKTQLLIHPSAFIFHPSLPDSAFIFHPSLLSSFDSSFILPPSSFDLLHYLPELNERAEIERVCRGS